ncbi:MAG: hypothetical protein KDB27_04030 [Planctomycetales bacterium]|nr:hypothetical protein [Planctomycetales bacterium]
MSKRNKSKKKRRSGRDNSKPTNAPDRKKDQPQPPYSHETRAADAVTVFWLLAGFASGMAQLAMFILRAARTSFEDLDRWAAFHGVVAVIAVVTGIITLVVTPIALRVRRIPPPQPIIAGMILLGGLPFAWVFLFPVR